MSDITMTQDGAERNSMKMEGTGKEQWTELKTRLKEQKRKNQDVISTKQRKYKASTFSRWIKKVTNG